MEVVEYFGTIQTLFPTYDIKINGDNSKSHLLEPMINISLCVHTTVGFGYPVAEHLMDTSEPSLKVWFLGEMTSLGGSNKRN